MEVSGLTLSAAQEDISTINSTVFLCIVSMRASACVHVRVFAWARVCVCFMCMCARVYVCVCR